MSVDTQPVPLVYIGLNERGIAYIRGTRMKVLQLAVEANEGWSVQQVREAHPHLSLSQIHAALAYYYDHREEVDAQIAERDRFAEEMRARHPNPLSRKVFEERLASKPSLPR
jgi:uncharacterized protein (DUF433 family)